MHSLFERFSARTNFNTHATHEVLPVPKDQLCDNHWASEANSLCDGHVDMYEGLWSLTTEQRVLPKSKALNFFGFRLLAFIAAACNCVNFQQSCRWMKQAGRSAGIKGLSNIELRGNDLDHEELLRTALSPVPFPHSFYKDSDLIPQTQSSVVCIVCLTNIGMRSSERGKDLQDRFGKGGI